MHIFMVILYHIGGEQFSMILQVFLVLNGSIRWRFCVMINARANSTFFRVKNPCDLFQHPSIGLGQYHHY